jgi:integrase
MSVASDLEAHHLGACVVLCLQTGIRTEKARALRWELVDLDGRPDEDPAVPANIAVWRSVREHGDTKTRLSRRTLSLPEHAIELLRDHRKRQEQARAKAGRLRCVNNLVYLVRAQRR